MTDQVLPDGLDERQFRELYRQHLEVFTPLVVSRLRALLTRTDVSPDVREVHLEVFPDESGDGEVSVWAYFEGPNKKVSRTDPTLFCGASLDLTDDVRVPLHDPRSYPFDAHDAAVGEVILWFSRCWAEAGGDRYRLPALISGHEDYGEPQSMLLNQAAREASGHPTQRHRRGAGS